MLTQQYDKYIDIEIETTAKGGVGQPKETYTLLKSVWCGIYFTGGRTQTDANGENVVTDAIFTFRYDSAINYKCRFKYENQYYKITHIEPLGRKDTLRVRTIMFFNE